MSDSLSITKLEIVGQSNSDLLVVAAAVEQPLDQNPAAVYLATLRPTGRRSMLRALTKVAEVASNGRHSALTLPWHLLRYQHTAAIVSVLQEQYRPATVNQMLSGLRSVLSHAENLGLMSAEDCRRAVKIKSVKAETLPRGRALKPGEMIALLNVCATDNTPAGMRDAALIATLYGAGLRRSEVVALDLVDYDQEQQAVTVRGGKGGKDRITYLAGGAGEALEDWLKVRGGEAGPLFYPLRRGGHLEKRRLKEQSVFDMLVRRGSEAKISSFSPHDLRRTFISDLLDAGADIATVQKLVGHANVQTTARYDRRGEVAKRKAAGLLHVPYQRH